MKPHTSDGGQTRYYLACARIPFPDVHRKVFAGEID